MTIKQGGKHERLLRAKKVEFLIISRLKHLFDNVKFL